MVTPRPWSWCRVVLWVVLGVVSAGAIAGGLACAAALAQPDDY